ncbi:arylsulfatase [Candidatus Poribacteria bacterium]|nr:arylsulfatase [Candidatus Poribacteria bacterium]MBT5711214.1 arylsulfatase [Candidatus Poribacteria bacterium]MBT7098241.1 arylsulfatase [Candidatus Poribacteria bacterium]MBT7806522.1 arylsulfatase [Candidatus Poribacteria bacterium]
MVRPNIVLIILDDLGPYEMSFLGHKKLRTPNIDRLAAQSMRFENAYSGAPVCAPARSTLLTGTHTGHTTVRGNLGGVPLLAEDFTFAQMLKRAGYATGGYGKWGVGDVGTDGVPERHGFDEFFGYYHQIHAHDFFTGYLWRNGEKVELADGEYSHYRIVDAAKRFIRENADGPFLCYLPWTPPHGHYQIPDDDSAWQELKDEPWPEDARRRAAMVHMVDRHVGEILDLLTELQLDENTVVLFCSDNGGGREVDDFFRPNRDLRGEKTNLYEGGIRVPMLARWPGRIEAGAVSPLLTYFPDFLPTIAEFTGSAEHLPDGLDGVSLAPTLLGRPEDQTEHAYLYWEYSRVGNWQEMTYVEDGPQQAVRMGQHKLVRMRTTEPFELYDLDADPNETTNIAPDHPAVVAEMTRMAEEAHTEPASQEEPTAPEGRRFW